MQLSISRDFLLIDAVRNSQCLSAEFGDCLLQHSEGQPPDPKSGGMVREAGEIHVVLCSWQIETFVDNSKNQWRNDAQCK